MINIEMNILRRIFFKFRYVLGRTPWDTNITPPEVEEAFAGFDSSGRAIDLGCGTGTNVIFMARHGWEVVGIDFVSEPVRKARRKARKAGVDDRTRFYHADVTQLKELDLGKFQYALDMGCFHGLLGDDRQAYLDGLAQILVPGAVYMLYAWKPHERRGRTFGITAEAAQRFFAPVFEITHMEGHDNPDKGSVWYWMEKR